MFQDKLTKEIAAAAAQIKTEPTKNVVNGNSVEGAVVSIMANEELKGNQHKIDANKNGKVDAHDFKLLRSKKKVEEGVKGAGVGAALGSVAGGPVGAAIGGALGHVAGEVLSSAKNKTKAIGRIIKGPSMADSKLKREDVEQIDEVGDTSAGRKMISSYVNKAIDDKSKDRSKGLRKATSRLYKDNYYGKKNEEVEQIDELSHDTLRSYVDKAKKENLPGKGGNRGVALLTPGTRDKGVHKAVDRMKKMKANEETEQLDELMGKGKLPAIASYHKEKGAEAKNKMETIRSGNTKLPVPKSTSAKILSKDAEAKYHSTQAKRADALMKKEEVEQLDEIGDTPAGQKMLRKVDSRAFYKGGTKSGGKGNMADAGEKTLERTQARIKKQPSLLSKAAGAVKKVLTREESELDEAFPTVADAKKRMAAGQSSFEKKKISTGTVYSRKYKAEPDDADDMPKKKAKTMKEMLDIYRQHGAESLVENLMIEEPTNDEYKKEAEIAQAKSEGKIRNDKQIAKAATQGVKMEEVEQIDELSKSTLSSYKTKASGQVRDAQDDLLHLKHSPDGGDRAMARDAGSTYVKRSIGVAQADRKMKKEEYELEMYDADEINGVQIDTIDERSMTDAEMNKREKIVKSMKKGIQGFKDRYGDDAKSVMYATATKQSMKEDAEPVDELYNPISVKKGVRRNVDSSGKVSYSGGVRVRSRGATSAGKVIGHEMDVQKRKESMWKQKNPLLSKIKSAGQAVGKAIDRVASIKVANKNRAGG